MPGVGWGWLGGRRLLLGGCSNCFYRVFNCFFKVFLTFGMRWGWLGGGSYCWEAALTAFVVLLIVF